MTDDKQAERMLKFTQDDWERFERSDGVIEYGMPFEIERGNHKWVAKEWSDLEPIPSHTDAQYDELKAKLLDAETRCVTLSGHYAELKAQLEQTKADLASASFSLNKAVHELSDTKAKLEEQRLRLSVCTFCDRDLEAASDTGEVIHALKDELARLKKNALLEEFEPLCCGMMFDLGTSCEKCPIRTFCKKQDAEMQVACGTTPAPKNDTKGGEDEKAPRTCDYCNGPIERLFWNRGGHLFCSHDCQDNWPEGGD